MKRKEKRKTEEEDDDSAFTRLRQYKSAKVQKESLTNATAAALLPAACSSSPPETEQQFLAGRFCFVVLIYPTPQIWGNDAPPISRPTNYMH
jgi:hypothetical protein